MARPAIKKTDAPDPARIADAKAVRQRQKTAQGIKDALPASFGELSPIQKDDLLRSMAVHFGFLQS